jgi:hypothetical protein
MTDDDETRSDPEPVEVTLTKNANVRVGYHRCSACRAWTPRPSDDVIRKFVQDSPGDAWIWPFGDWEPPGWITISEPDQQRSRRICEVCAASVFHALMDPGVVAEVDRLKVRQQELLATIARLTNEIPYPEEIRGWFEQRAQMIAEIGTLRSELREAHDRAALYEGRTEALAQASDDARKELAAWQAAVGGLDDQDARAVYAAVDTTLGRSAGELRIAMPAVKS